MARRKAVLTSPVPVAPLRATSALPEGLKATPGFFISQDDESDISVKFEDGAVVFSDGFEGIRVEPKRLLALIHALNALSKGTA